MEEIQAYCEKICVNFHQIVNRSAQLFSSLISNLTSCVINKKFNELSRKEGQSHFMKASKDYNAIADSILKLTGNHLPQNKQHKPTYSNMSKSQESYSSHQSYESMEEDEVYLPSEPIKVEQEYSPVESTLNVKRMASLENYKEEEQIEEAINKKKVKPNKVIHFQTKDSDEFYIGTNNYSWPAKEINTGFLEPEEFLNAEDFTKYSSDMFSQIREDFSHFENFDIDTSIFDEQSIVEWHI